MSRKKSKKVIGIATSGIIALSSFFATPISTILAAPEIQNQNQNIDSDKEKDAGETTTPIKHVVVIYDENISFDHYFGTYPVAQNPPGEPQFRAAPDTPKDINNYIIHPELLTNNPNGVNPQRLDRSQSATADMDHGYTAEQQAYDNGLVDKFVTDTGHGQDLVLNYYDGNTVTAMWNYAQHYALNDNSFGTQFGPTLPGHINLITGQTNGVSVYSSNAATGTATPINPGDKAYPSTSVIIGTMIGNLNPYYDKASTGKTAEMSGKNVGDLLNAKGVTWGWFIGGFRNTSETHKINSGSTVKDYAWPFTDPFQFYKSTANPNHIPPSSADMIGKADQANHQYDLTDFWTAAKSGNLPAVSFLKPPAGWSGHAGVSTSGPMDEQQWVANTINGIQSLPEWKDTAIVIAYDDSDGWYDHVMPPTISNPNNAAGYGPRQPLLVISPYSKPNYVDHTLTDQASILKFIEDNWNLGLIGDKSMDQQAGTLTNMFDFSNPSQKAEHHELFLDPSTGEPENSETARTQFESWLRSLYLDAGVQMSGWPSVTGKVTDPQTGKPVNGVSVVATNSEGKSQSVKTNADGQYLLGMPPGKYTLSVKRGFQSGTSDSVNLENGKIKTIDLQIGELNNPIAGVSQETLDVNPASPRVDANPSNQYHYLMNNKVMATISSQIADNNQAGTFQPGWLADFALVDSNALETLDWSEWILSPVMNDPKRPWNRSGEWISMPDIQVSGNTITASGQAQIDPSLKTSVTYKLLPNAPIMKVTLEIENTGTNDFNGYFQYLLDPDSSDDTVFVPGIAKTNPGFMTSGWTGNYIYDGPKTAISSPAHAIAWTEDKPAGLSAFGYIFGASFDASVKAGDKRTISWYHITDYPSDGSDPTANIARWASQLSTIDTDTVH